MILPDQIRKISFVGAGNVAWHLARGLSLKGYKIVQVWSRTMESASDLAQKVHAEPVTNLESLSRETDIIIVAVSDSAISEVLSQLKHTRSIIVHTSGSVSMNELAGSSGSYGVFYPLQTFSKHIPVNLAEVPFCIEASGNEELMLIRGLALSLSANVHDISSEDRLLLHLSAVFASNYSNFMYMLASDILNKCGLSFDLLKPLVAETAHKVITSAPSRVQTGPAKRGDLNTIDKHLKLLASMPEYAEIYRLLADKIRQRFHP